MYLTKKELAEKFKISIAKIDKMMKEGLPFTKIRKSVRFKLDEVDKWIEEGCDNDKKR